MDSSPPKSGGVSLNPRTHKAEASTPRYQVGSIVEMVKSGIEPPRVSSDELRDLQAHCRTAPAVLLSVLRASSSCYLGHRELCRYAAHVALSRMIDHPGVQSLISACVLFQGFQSLPFSAYKRGEDVIIAAGRAYNFGAGEELNFWFWDSQDKNVYDSLVSRIYLSSGVITGFMAGAMSELPEEKFGRGVLDELSSQYAATEKFIADLLAKVAEASAKIAADLAAYKRYFQEH